ncbi:hypothetical protein [Staphylococcus phage vB_StaM_SA1]|nr:hypothetical protein [Staphylococcus phage vB_StaM_SA1]
MKKLIVTLSIMAVIAVLVSGCIFGYSQFKKINDGNGIQISINSDKGEANKSSESTTEEDKQVDEEEQTQEVQSTEDVNESDNNDVVVSRDNVFDYLFAGLDKLYGDAWDKDQITFQEPKYESSTGNWVIMANNKSGSGGYVFKVSASGTVYIYNSSGDILDDSVDVKPYEVE